MLNDLLLNESTKKQLSFFINAPTHSLLLVGEPGAGKGTLAVAVAGNLLGLTLKQLHAYGSFSREVPENGVITIDTVRRLKKFLRLKTIGNQPIRRIILIEDAQAMTPEAQNSLLKILEEPPSDSILILTCDNSHSLLPTIVSRTPVIVVKPVTANRASEFFVPRFKSANFEKAYIISEGNVGLMAALLNDDLAHPLAKGIADAKKLLKNDLFERLKQVEELAHDKTKLAVTAGALYKLIHAALGAAVQKDDSRQAKRLSHALKTVISVEQAIAKNSNTKLALTHLLVNV